PRHAADRRGGPAPGAGVGLGLRPQGPSRIEPGGAMGVEESVAAAPPVETGGRAQLARRAGVVSAAGLGSRVLALRREPVFPCLLLVALAAVAMGILNTRHIFGVPAAASAFFNLGSIVGGLGCAAWLAPGYLSAVLGRGPAPDAGLVTRALTGMAIGTLAGGLLQLLGQVPSLWRVGFRYRPLLALRDPGLRQVARLMAPATIGAAAVQVNVFVNN